VIATLRPNPVVIAQIESNSPSNQSYAASNCASLQKIANEVQQTEGQCRPQLSSTSIRSYFVGSVISSPLLTFLPTDYVEITLNCQLSCVLLIGTAVAFFSGRLAKSTELIDKGNGQNL
jgi:hypothetical protein